jgi:hypothetical protein
VATTVHSMKVEINAPIACVWNILTNLADYPKWNPFTYRVESSLVVGEPAILYVRMSETQKRVQPEIVTSCDAQQQLSWRSKTPAFILQANRLQKVEAIDAEHTRYYTYETFSGLLEPLIMRLYQKDVERGFNDVCHALKAYAEATC